ncbi:MAG: hypothetical protein HBSAPP03_19660 [Phycisphaerae bacterium]|nr:MAG: hypothetical protein HBSAPP03_19660 [Phycisphaerae bacterium]
MPGSTHAIVKQFEDRYARTLGRADRGGPPWNDGSDAAALLAIWWHLEPMISHGGWPSIYYNRVGWAVPLAARGYRLLGMHECAERCGLALRLVGEAEARHPGADCGSDEWLSCTLMDEINDEQWDMLDTGWFELTRHTPNALAAFLRTHPMSCMPP